MIKIVLLPFKLRLHWAEEGQNRINETGFDPDLHAFYSVSNNDLSMTDLPGKRFHYT